MTTKYFQTRTESTEEGIIEVLGIDVYFGRHHVLRDVSLRVPRGQTLAIIGESGCGKTVLLKTVIGLIRPSRGSVLFDKKDLNLLNDRELTQQRIRFGFVFQQAALFDSLTVGQNIAFPLRQHTDFGRGKIREIVMDRLAQVGLPAWVVPKKPAELSGGMRKRVGLARALALEPELILYDEPTTGLDPIMGDVINELMISTSRNNDVTSVIVTHDMNSARKVADRIVMIYPLARLDAGESQIIFDGPPEDLDHTLDKRVLQFTRGEAGERLMEMRDEDRVLTPFASDHF